MDLDILPEAEAELDALHRRDLSEWAAMFAALEQLEAAGLNLGRDQAHDVKGTNLWELRPRRGRSRWRALYRREGNLLRVATICPEAKVDPRGFRAGVRRALKRLGPD